MTGRPSNDLGLALDLSVARGFSTVPTGTVDDGEMLGDYAFTRVELSLDGLAGTNVRSGPLAEHQHGLEGTLDAGFTSRNVARDEELAAGGDVPGALRLGGVERSVPFPGYGPYALTGENLAVGGLRWVIPVAPRIRAG